MLLFVVVVGRVGVAFAVLAFVGGVVGGGVDGGTVVFALLLMVVKFVIFARIPSGTREVDREEVPKLNDKDLLLTLTGLCFNCPSISRRLAISWLSTIVAGSVR